MFRNDRRVRLRDSIVQPKRYEALV